MRHAAVGLAFLGLGSGLVSSLLLLSLDIVTSAREQFPGLLVFLPLAGFLSLLLQQRLSSTTGGPILFVWLGSLISHLFGASVGREGVAARLCSELAIYINQKGHLEPIFIRAGLAAGFGSVFGAPWAGCLFGLEMIKESGRLKAAPFCFLATFLAYAVTKLMPLSHTPYPPIPLADFDLYSLSCVALVGIASGLVSVLFNQLQSLLTRLGQRITYPPYRGLLGGALVSLILLIFGSQYAGLSLPFLLESFKDPAPVFAFAIKLVATVLSLASGFQGGEVTPLLFIGASLGNTLSPVLALPLDLSVAVGMVAVLAGVLKIPLTCAVLACELWGWPIGLCALLATLFSRVVREPQWLKGGLKLGRLMFTRNGRP